MKVSDVMSRQVDYVSINDSVKDVSRIIFGAGINGVPVCEKKKVVGFVTERDILSKFYPSIEEYIEDPLHTSDFEGMEAKVKEILELPVHRIMSKNPKSVTPDTPLLKAQSLMQLEEIGRLSVVDKKGHLVGIISKGDIFRAAVGDKLPYASDEEYHDWLSRHYDLTVEWEERLGNEVPDLTNLFNKEKVKYVLDVGCGTGEHDMALAKKGFKVFGIESSTLMYNSAKTKLKSLSEDIAEKIEFAHGDYVNVLNKSKGQFGAAIFMGNAFLHIHDNYREVLSAVSKVLYPQNSLMVFQLINYEKVFNVKKRYLDLNFNKSKLGIMHEHAFLEFYDPPRDKSKSLTLNMVILDFDGKKWKHRSMNSTPIVKMGREEMSELLKKNGFKKVSFYGSNFLGPLFKDEFDPKNSDWLNVVASR